MAPTTRETKNKKLTDEQKKLKRKEYDRKRRERMKSDPQQLEIQRQKEKEKYKKKLEKGQRKKIQNMSEREKRAQRKRWKQWARSSYEKNKIENSKTALTTIIESASPHTPDADKKITPRQQSIARVIRKRIRKNRGLNKMKIEKLEDENKRLRRKIETLRKRAQRSKKNKSLSSSPASKIQRLMKNGTKEQIRKKLLFGETVCDAMQKYYKTANSVKQKVSVRSIFKKNEKFFTKYKIRSQLNHISPKLFHLNYTHRSNNAYFRNKMNRLRTEIEKDVIKFMEDDDNSRLCPGKRDFVVRKKVKHQKRFLSGTMKHLHEKFSEQMDYSLGYSTFCRLKPFWVVPMKVTERDTCACKIHENMDLLVSSLYGAGVLSANSTKELLNGICCDRTAISCLQRKCAACKNQIIPYNEVEDKEIKYYQWNTVNEKITLKGKAEKTVKHVVKERTITTIWAAVEFLESIIEKFMNHEAILIHQARNLKFLRENMSAHEALIHCDFSENYSTKLSTEIQSFHFGGSRKQFTLHTVQVYYRPDNYSVVKSQSLCTISECNDHGAAAVWAHLKPILEFIKKFCPEVKIIHFQSDSPSTQYRNKTMFYLLCHALLEEVGGIVSATWNFTAPGHGKGAPDGIGGCLKRTADKVVAEGSDINEFSTFVHTLQSRTRNIILYIVNKQDVEQVSTMIPRVLPTFHGTMKVFQVVFHSTAPGVLKMNTMSCFHCLSCDKFKIGSHYIDYQRPQLLRSVEQDQLSFDQPPLPGSYVIAKSSSSDETFQAFYVYDVKSCEQIQVIQLEPIESSSQHFTLKSCKRQCIQLSDILKILPAPTNKVINKTVIKFFELPVFIQVTHNCAKL